MGTYLVTGVAGFIASHLTEKLLSEGHNVNGIDDFSTGKVENMKGFINHPKFAFLAKDINNLDDFKHFFNVDGIFHLAAHGSVPKSIINPKETYRNNAEGSHRIFFEARHAGVKNIVFASSSSVYGDDPSTVKVEHLLGKPLSPYANSKKIVEEMAQSYYQSFGINYIGLRFFNVYGPRQHPTGPYSAVIPRWVSLMMKGNPVEIYGDGKQVRDFTYVNDVVDACLQAMEALELSAKNPMSSFKPKDYVGFYNVGNQVGNTLLNLHEILINLLTPKQHEIHFLDKRNGDILKSVADISKARKWLGYDPIYSLEEGLKHWLFQSRLSGQELSVGH